MGSKLPPFHGHCRTTVVPGLTETIVNRSGKKIEGKFKFPEMKNEDDKLDITKGLNEVHKNYENLSKDELMSIVNSYRNLEWPKDWLEKKYDKHGSEFNGDINDYQKLSKKYLKEFDKVYIYAYHNQYHRLMFYNESDNAAVILNPEFGRVENMYKPAKKSLDYYKNIYMELL